MVKKSLVGIFVFLFLVNFISINWINAEDIPVALNVPVVGNIGENSSLISNFEKFREISANLSEEEARKDYLYREWTKMAKNDKIAAVFFYTDMFFSTFDPLWENIFGIKFSWSWEFIFCLVLWILLIVMIFMPVRELVNLNWILAFGISVIISCLVGKSGVIKQSADTLTFAVKNIWLAVLCLVIVVIIGIIYSSLMQKAGYDIRKQSEEEELRMAKESIKAHGKASKKALDEGYSKG